MKLFSMLYKAVKKITRDKNLLLSYIAQAIQAIGTYALMTMLVTTGNAALFGQYLLLKAVSGVLVAFLTFRTSESIVKFSSSIDGVGAIWQTLGLGFFLDLVLALLLLLLAYALFPFISDFFEGLRGIGIKDYHIYIQGVAFFVMTSSFSGVFQAIGEYYLVNCIKITQSLGLVLGVFVSLEGITLYDLFNAFRISSLAALLVCIIIFLSKISYITAINTKNEFSISSYWRFMSSTFLSSLFKGINQNVDILIIARFASSETVAIYGIVKQFLLPASMFVQPLSVLRFKDWVSLSTKSSFDVFRGHVVEDISSISKQVSYLSFMLLAALLVFWVCFSGFPGLQLGWFLLFATLDLFVKNQMWWVRPYGNTTSPHMVAFVSGYSTLFSVLLFFLPESTSIGLIAGIILCNSVCVYLFWLSRLMYEKKY